jgi:hypothetical protein
MEKKIALATAFLIFLLAAEFIQEYPCVECSDDETYYRIKIDYPQAFSEKVLFVSFSVEHTGGYFILKSGNVTCYLDGKQILFSEAPFEKKYTINLDYPVDGRHEIKVELILVTEFFKITIVRKEATLSFDLSEPTPTPTTTPKPTATPEITLTTSPSSSPADKTNQPPMPVIALLVAVICAAPIAAGMLLFRRKRVKQKTKPSSN